MKLGPTFSRIAGVLLLAVIGALLIYLPSWIGGHYATISQYSPILGTVYLVLVCLGGLLVSGSLIYTAWKLWGNSIAKQLTRQRRNRNPSKLSRSEKEREFQENIGIAETLRDAQKLEVEIDPALKELLAKRQQQVLEIVAFGTISSGKSSVLNLLAGREVFATDVRGGTTTERCEIPWPDMDKVILVDTPGLGEVDGEQHVWIAADSAKEADLVLLVVDGPLRESEHQLLEKLGEMEKRIVICLNKCDWYQPEDREKLLNQLRQQTSPYVDHDEIVAIQAQTGFRRRKRVLADGTTVDERVESTPDIESLADCMLRVLKRDGKDLLLANLLIQSRTLVEKTRERARQEVDARALGIVEKYMWTSGGAAAINPFPVVDILVGMGISTKMIVDLAELYQQRVDLETASRWLGQMGKILVSVVGSQGVALVATSVVASLIKTVPIAGTIAGNVTQGAIQGLVTRWIGTVFMEYFRNEMQEPEGGLAGLARRQWDKLTTLDELRKLVQKARTNMSN